MAIKSLSHSSLTDNRFYRSMLVGNTAYEPLISDYDLLETETLPSSQATITFNNLTTNYASTYRHLQLRILARTDRTGAHNEPIQLFVNGSNSGYNYQQLYGAGGAPGSTAAADESKMLISEGATSASSVAYSFGASVIDIYDAFNSNKHKTFRSLNGYRETNYGIVSLYSGVWRNNAAIDSLLLDPLIGGNFLANSRFSLYGLKAS